MAFGPPAGLSAVVGWCGPGAERQGVRFRWSRRLADSTKDSPAPRYFASIPGGIYFVYTMGRGNPIDPCRLPPREG
jgi:hypothetical protein